MSSSHAERFRQRRVRTRFTISFCIPDPKPAKRIEDPELMRRLHLEYLGEPCERCELRAGTGLHHKVLRSQGGDDVRENLEWLCVYCHTEEHT